MTQIIDGKLFAKGLRARIAKQVATMLAAHHVTPGLAVVLAGDNPASQVYVRNKVRQAIETGMNSFEHRFDDDVTESTLLRLIAQLNGDSRVNGILVQLPLPEHIDSKSVLMAIDPAKDVDGFHPLNVGNLTVGHQAMVPCTPLGCMMLLRGQLGDLTGESAVIVGRSNIVGKPMATLLLRENCTVTVTHSRTRDLAEECRRADILVAAVGRPHMIRADWVKPGATVIDVGINRIEAEGGKTRLVGDVDFEGAKEVAGAITPVPGGVGPMTIASLLANTLIATCRQKKIEEPDF